MIVAVDGFGASGKTRAARSLARQFSGHVIGLDDFTRPGTPTWEHERFVAEVLVPLRAGRDAVYRPWSYADDRPRTPVRVPAGSLVIVEGVSALARAVVDRVGIWWDLALWIDAPARLRRERIDERDGPSLLSRWQREWWPSEERYFADEDPLSLVDFVLRAG